MSRGRTKYTVWEVAKKTYKDIKIFIYQCLDDEFGCSNGTCIPMSQRCDGVVDCPDKLDELRFDRCPSMVEKVVKDH